MKIFQSLETFVRRTLDYFYARRPQAVPAEERLRHCKIVAHRGDCDNRRIFENTIAAFDRAGVAGVWGIEFDLRWTKDLHPVALHDKNLHRVFGLEFDIHQASLAELKSECPAVPALAELIPRYGKKLHLMIETKAEAYPDPVRQNRTLEALLSPLAPAKDYHLLALKPHMFNVITGVPRSAFVPVARLNFSRLSKLTLAQNYAGLAGHYLLLTGSRLKKHKAANQKLATGYVNSKNCLFRELNRGVDWIFSDNAVELQQVIKKLL